ncbi:hypothetical protein CVU75_02880 [Candidatus Dependentiae bacterium HGW-Dependentiae-1]|nr:MAG: hypothetical protein CVU75_02880 [Candidatus Dependentiae bacterium HGW-Dependentiae-1]
MNNLHRKYFLGFLITITCSVTLFFSYQKYRAQKISLAHMQAQKYYTMAKQFHSKRDFNNALIAYKNTIACDSHHEFAYKAMGYAYLDMGDLPHAWASFGQSDDLYKSTAENPWWTDSNPTGKTILIQDAGGFDGNPSIGKGFGDCFQALRYAKKLKKYQTTIIVQARPALIPLLSHCPYIDTLIAEGTPCPPYDIKTTTARLFRNFNTSINSIPHEIPYLYAAPELIDHWKRKLSHDTHLKIGLCWNSQRYVFTNTNTNSKSILHDQRPIPVEHLMQLAKLPKISLYSLQKIAGPEKNSYAPIISFGPEFDATHGSFMDTAALMKNLDLVITVDTAIAHLAGALGIPVWVLLPYVADWRWFSNRDDSPWYPSMRLFRQPRTGDWNSVMHKVAYELNKLLEKKYPH